MIFPVPYGRARFAHPGQNFIFKPLPTPCTGVQSVIFGLAQSFSQPLHFVPFWLSDAFCPEFSGCRAGSRLFYDLAQNSAHPQKTCARTLHTLPAIKQSANLAQRCGSTEKFNLTSAVDNDIGYKFRPMCRRLVVVASRALLGASLAAQTLRDDLRMCSRPSAW